MVCGLLFVEFDIALIDLLYFLCISLLIRLISSCERSGIGGLISVSGLLVHTITCICHVTRSVLCSLTCLVLPRIFPYPLYLSHV